MKYQKQQVTRFKKKKKKAFHFTFYSIPIINYIKANGKRNYCKKKGR
jgi:hypothetical protein